MSASREQLEEAAEKVVARSLVAINRCIAQVETMLDSGGGYNKSLAEHLARLASEATKIMRALQ